MTRVTCLREAAERKPSAGARPFAGWVRVATELASDLGFVELSLGDAHASLQQDRILVRGLVSAAVRLP